MSLPGFELLYLSAAPQIRNSDDAAITAVHWILISNGLKCCGCGETWPEDQSQNIAGSEALPSGWNGDRAIYSLRYVDPSSNRTYLMKALPMDGALMLNFVRCFDEKASSLTVRSRDYVNEDTSTANKAFTNLPGLNSIVSRELFHGVVPDAAGNVDTNRSPSASSSSSQQNRPERSPLMIDPRGGLGFPRPHPFGPGSTNIDPFAVGGSDLDPLSGGMGGGMFMDPRNFPRPGGVDPSFINPQGFPPGAVPPGARYDPTGPLGVRPNPDPDHEQPPGYDDMFM